MQLAGKIEARELYRLQEYPRPAL